MFETWGRVIYRRRRLVLVITLIGVVFAGVWGTGVFGSLQTAGGFNTPNSQSQRSSDLASAAFGRDTGDVVVLYQSATRTVADPAYRAAVTRTLGALPRSKVESVATYWSTGSRQFVSASGHQTYAVIELAGADDAARITNFDAIAGRLAAPGLAEQGILGLHVPEADGGQGYGLPELAVAVEELGRALIPGAFLPTVLASAALIEAGAGGKLVAGLADGSKAGAVALTTGLTGRPGPDGSLVVGNHLNSIRVWRTGLDQNAR